MNNFLDKIPVSPITSFGNPSVPNGATFGTNFSILQTGGYMEVYNLSGLTYTIPPATTGVIEFSGNSIPIQLVKGSGLAYSPDVLTLNSDNISSGRRKLGMLVYVYETNKLYQFRIDNYDTLWNNATGATGIGGPTVVISDYGTTVRNNSAAGIAFINAWTASTISGIGGYNDTNASWRILKTGGDSFTGGTVTGATNFTGGLTANTISATTYQNLPSTPFLPLSGGTVTGATNFTGGLSSNTISATTYQNLPSTPFLPLSGGTITGATIFTNGLTANTISATTYQNLPATPFLRLSGGTVTGATNFTGGLSANTISANFQDGTHTDMSTLIFQGGTMGLISGGTISINSGLNVNVSSGFGYLQNSSDQTIYQRVDWGLVGITLTSNSNLYLYFNQTGNLYTSGTIPTTVNNIVIGRVVTNSTGVEFIDSSPMNADHTSNRYGNLFRNALGPIYVSGSIVVQNTTPFKLNVTSGEYYYSTNQYLPSGGSGFTFTQYYRNGSGGWNTSATTFVNNTQFDNNGTLSGLTASAFTKHTLYVVGGGVNEKYFLVLGQNQYTTLVETENALLPTPPTFFNDSVSQITSIYIKQGNPNILQIQDIRPVIGFKAGGVNASSLHANLLGLASDDHKQYLLTDGSRPMGGVLNMSNNLIISAGTINGVTIESHASRHKNGGSDEVATSTPGAYEIPKADAFGKLDSWISDSSSSVKGLTKLTVNPVSPTTPISVGENDLRFQNSITGVTNTSGSLIFSNNSGTTINFSGLTIGGLTANTISATTYTNVNHNNATNLQGGQPSEYYHLTSSQLNRVLNLIYVNNVVTFSISPTSGERGVSQSLNVTYRMTPNDDTYTAATINPVGYNVLPFANGTQQTTGVTNSSSTTAYTLNYGYTRNGSGNTGSSSATYTAYIPQWVGVSVSTGLTSNTYESVISLGLTKVIQSSSTQTATLSATNQYVWFISNTDSATITQGGFTQSIASLNVYDGTKEFQKNSVLLTLSNGITTSTVYIYRTTSVKNITSLNYQIT